MAVLSGKTALAQVNKMKYLQESSKQTDRRRTCFLETHLYLAMVASKATGSFLKWTHFPWSNPVICNITFVIQLLPSSYNTEAGPLFSFTLAGSSADTKKATDLCFFTAEEALVY